MNFRLQVFGFILLTSMLAGSLQAVQKVPIQQPWLRLEGDVKNLQVAPKGRYLAYTNSNNKNLRVLEIDTKKVFKVSARKVGHSFFWAPDGLRLFYRELSKDKTGQVISTLKAFDTRLQSSNKISSYPFVTGLLTFDPRDMRMHLLSNNGLHTKKIVFPDQRLARWQIAQRTENGKWIAAQQGIIWLTDGGYTMKRVSSGKVIESFDVSPDGTAITWAEEDGKLYKSRDGVTAEFIGYGRDPKWHPNQLVILYAGARRVGNTIVSYDLRLENDKGTGRYLTNTQASSERWPDWSENGNSIYYTKEQSTDLYKLEFDVKE